MRRKVQIDEDKIKRQKDIASEIAAEIGKGLSFYGENPKYFVRTFGCQQNFSDSEVISAIMEEAGFKPAEFEEDATVILINTCSIRDNADRRLYGYLGSLKHLASEKDNLTVAVCGCMAVQKIHIDKIKFSFPHVKLIFGPNEIWRLPEMLKQRSESSKRSLKPDTTETIAEGMPVKRERKYRALVSIMYGCNNFCSFCIVPKTRGRERSRKAADIIAEIKEAIDEGIPEIMLLGQNVNSWGDPAEYAAERRNLAETYAGLTLEDIEGIGFDEYLSGEKEPDNFASLLAVIANLPGLKRVRFMSSNPFDFSPALIAAIAKYDTIERHVHLPLQSGSDKVLEEMRRKHDIKTYRKIVNLLREAVPEISISTDIIVAFPGESEEDFQKTLNAVQEFAFDSAFYFIYSPRKGTPAAERDDMIDENIAHERFERLQALQNANCLKSNQKMQGRTVEVLLEGKSTGRDDVLTGRDSAFRLYNIELGKAAEKLPEEAFAGHDRVSGAPLNSDFFEGKFAEVEVKNAKSFSLEAELKNLI